MNFEAQACYQAEVNFFEKISVDCLHTNHLIAFATGVQSPTLNHAVVHHVDDTIQTSLERCCDFYARKHVPWELGVSEMHEQAFKQALAQHPWVQVDTGVAMGLGLQDLKLEHSPATLEIKPMQDALDAWGVPVTLGFESTFEAMQPYLLRHQVASKGRDTMMHFSGFVDNQAVCSLTLTFCENNVRIDDVATIPQYQRQGYATQLLRSALAYAKAQGAQGCFLEASQDGLRVYENLGFKTLFKNHYYELAQIM